MRTLRTNSLMARPHKCTFMQREIEFLPVCRSDLRARGLMTTRLRSSRSGRRSRRSTRSDRSSGL